MYYHAAISFAGEDRHFVRKLVEHLKQRGIRVFYDQDEQASLWGVNQHEFFQDLLLHRTQFCIMVVSKHYKDKIWPKMERQAAFARAMGEKDTYVLPIRLDDTQLPGLLPTVGYLDIERFSTDDIADLLLEKIHSNPGYQFSIAQDAHPGSHPTENPVARRLYQEITRYWPSRKPVYHDGFLNYDVDQLIKTYSKEMPVAPNIPYCELVSWVHELNEGLPLHLAARGRPGEFRFNNSIAGMADLREAGFQKRRQANVGISNEKVISLQRFDEGSGTFSVQQASYHDQVRSNLIMDFESAGKESLRSLLNEQFEGKLPPLGSGYLADTVGAAVLLFFHHGDDLFPYLVPRSKSMPVFPGGWHPSASGAIKCPDEFSTDRSFDATFVDDLYDEIREEIGLFRDAAEKRHYFATDEAYKPFRSFVGNLEGDDVSPLRPLSFCREMLRGGKPQLFFVGYTPLSWTELTSRRVMATKVANRMGRREEIDHRLVHMMPELAKHEEQYDLWSKAIHESGYTFELLPMLHYAAQLAPGVLTRSA